MQRWIYTLGLVGLAIIAAALVPSTEPVTEVLPTQPATSTPAPISPTHPVDPPDPLPTELGTLDVDVRLDRHAVLAGFEEERFLAVTISAPAATGITTRRPVDIGVVMDTSGSMAARGKIDYARRAARLLVSSVSAEDVFSLVTFNDDATVTIPATHVYEPTALHHAIDRIYEGGGTNFYGGLDRGATEVQRSLQPGAVGRVIVLSDGNANVGIVDPSAFIRRVGQLNALGISVSTIGLGLDYNEDLLARIADAGGGSYDFVDDPKELEGVFTDELDRSASLVARELQIRLTLPTHVEPLEVIGWDADTRHDGWVVSMGDIYAGATRKLIARVRITAPSEGSVDVASIDASWTDLAIDGPGQAHRIAHATATHSDAVVTASLNTEAFEDANRAWGNWFLDRSARAYERGEIGKAKEYATTGQGVLEAAALELDSEELRAEAADLQAAQSIYDAFNPNSVEGKRSIKTSKEQFRGRAR